MMAQASPDELSREPCMRPSNPSRGLLGPSPALTLLYPEHHSQPAAVSQFANLGVTQDSVLSLSLLCLCLPGGSHCLSVVPSSSLTLSSDVGYLQVLSASALVLFSALVHPSL